MRFFWELGHNRVLSAAVIAWFIAQLLKFIICLVENKRLDFTRLIGLGGMPSSHSAFVVALTTAVGQMIGYDSVEFAICACLSLIVMIDASGVRRQAGEHAKLLNQIVEKMYNDEDKDVSEELRELLGHTPVQVIAGFFIGVVVAFIMVP